MVTASDLIRGSGIVTEISEKKIHDSSAAERSLHFSYGEAGPWVNSFSTVIKNAGGKAFNEYAPCV
jgi:hypothetical protein